MLSYKVRNNISNHSMKGEFFMYIPIKMNRSMKFGNNYWISYSPKIGRVVEFFSDLEYDNWLHIETNPNIISFCEQPLRINVDIDGEIKESIFDMWVLYKDHTEEFIEVKYNKEINGSLPKAKRSQKQIKAQQKWCIENGYKYSVKTDLEIRNNLTYLNTLKYIISEVKSCNNIDNSDCIKVLNILSNRSLSLISIIKKLEFEQGYTIKIICYLIYTGIIKIVNPEIEFSFSTKVIYNG